MRGARREEHQVSLLLLERAVGSAGAAQSETSVHTHCGTQSCFFLELRKLNEALLLRYMQVISLFAEFLL